jgi:hypothetical protein
MSRLVTRQGDQPYRLTVERLQQTVGMIRAIKEQDQDCYDRGEDFFDSVLERAHEVLVSVLEQRGATEKQMSSAKNWAGSVENWFDRSDASDLDWEDYLEDDEQE